MDNGWERFENSHARFLDGAAVTIRRDGGIAVSPAAYADLGSPKRVALFWHAQRRAIGIAPAQESDTSKLKVTATGSAVAVITARAFLLHYAIKPVKATRYPAAIEQNGSGPMLVIELGGDK